MPKITKKYFRIIIVCLIVLGLYFAVNHVTSLKIFPKKIHSGQSYISLIAKYGVPKILKQTKLKLAEQGETIIPGRECRNSIILQHNANYSKLYNNKIKQSKQGNNTPNNKSKNNMIDKIFTNFTGYVQKLESEVARDTDSKKLEFNNPKANQLEHTPPKNEKDKAKFYRADVYKSTLLVRFKINNKFLIISLEENFFNCVFPYKTQFFTYKRTNDNYILYYPRGITNSDFERFLNKKKFQNNKFSYFWDWKTKRTMNKWKKFYRLYKFTLPTSTTCMLINNNMILYGNNIHKKKLLLKVVKQSL